MEVTIECDLRHLFGPIRDQGLRPTCMAFAASDTHAAARPGWTPLSCEYAYYHALKRDGGNPDDGVTPDAVFETIREEGQPPETEWVYLPRIPVDVTRWRPPAKAGPLYRRDSVFTHASVAAIKQRLDAGSPVIVTLCLSDSFYLPGSDGIISSKEQPDPQRRHAVIAVGHGTRNGDRYIMIRNSWGEQWGIEGYAWIEHNYLAQRLYIFAEMREDLTNVSTNRNTKDMRASLA